MSRGAAKRPGRRGATGFSELEPSGPIHMDTEAEYDGHRVPVAHVAVPAIASRRAPAQPQSAAGTDASTSSRVPGSGKGTDDAPGAPVDESASGRWKSTSIAMAQFLERSTQTLNILFEREVDPRVSTPCPCGSTLPRIYRCVDCVGLPPCCCTCIPKSHIHSPLHRIEEWTGSYFARSSFNRLKSVFYLGHDGHRCPNAHPDTDKSISLVIVHTNGIHKVNFLLCHCAPRVATPIQLLRAGFYPATWEQTSTAFTIKVLEHYHLDSVQSRKSAYDYWAVLRRLTDNTREGPVPPRYEELLRASREWRALKRLKRSGQALGIADLLPGGSDTVAVICPACPRPGMNMPDDWQDHVTEENLHTYTVFIGIDGNFQAVTKVKPHDANDIPLLDGRGYFVNTKEFAIYLDDNSVDQPGEHTSDCANLKSMKMLTARKGISIAGLVAIFCKHSLYWRNTMVDLKVGEKFCILDYALFMAIRDDSEGALNWILTCDKGCQYGVNLKDRFRDRFPSANAAIARLKVLVPKLHLQGHKEECRFKYSLNYTRYCGRTDGEHVERPWGHSNDTARITRDMNPGHRKDTFEDCNGDWNYCKIVGMVTFLLKKLTAAYTGRAEAAAGFDALCAATTPAQRAAWEKLPQEPYVRDGWLHSIYRADRRKLPSYKELLNALKRQQAQASELDDHIEKILCPLTFLTLGLALEEQQIALRVFADGLPKPERCTREQSMELCLRRGQLRDEISKFRAMQQVHMPALGPTLMTEDFSRDIDEDYGLPEEDTLDMPSTFADAQERDKRGFTALGAQEYRLRCGKAASALAGLRVAAQLWSRLLVGKRTHVTGQNLKTRSEAALDSARKDVDQHAELYTRQYEALARLGIPAEDTTRFKPLLKSDLANLHMSISRPEKVGESHAKPAWFWGGDRDPDEAAAKEMDSLTQEELRVRWFRARANLERFTEEVDIVHAELDRTLRNYQRMRDIWRTLAERHATPPANSADGATTRSQSGRRAYALKQSAINQQRAEEALRACESAAQLREDNQPKEGTKKRGPRQLDKRSYEWSYYCD